MTRTEFIQKVMERIDEVGLNETVSLNFPIEPFILESTTQLLSSLPREAQLPLRDFSSSPINQSSNGSGRIELPSGFLKLHSFKLDCWLHSIYSAKSVTEEELFRQNFRATRSSSSRPIAFIDNNELIYFAPEANGKATIECAKAICAIDDISLIDDIYCDALSWLCASKVLQVMDEASLSERAYNIYNQLLATFNQN